MNVCLVSLAYKPYRSSGLTIYAEDLARGLGELGCQVSVLAARRAGLPAHSRVEGVEVHRAALGGLDWITYAQGAARMLQELQQEAPFDIVHFLDVHFAYPYQGAYIASLWQSFRQRRTAQDGGPYHTGQIDRLRRLAYYHIAQRCMEEPSLRRASRLVAGCESTRQEFIQHYDAPAARIDLALQGIDTNFFRPAPRDETRTLRHRLGFDGLRLLLFMGFITPRKGLEYLGAALRLLPPDVHLLIAGRWAAHCRQRFYQAAGEAAGRVHELGFIPDAERPAYYSLADVYVSPSLLEGLGITPIEAMACGTPAIVASGSSGPEEVGEAGLLVPPGEAPALAAAIRQLLDDPGLHQCLSHLGRRRVLENFTYQRMAQDTYRAYGRIDDRL